MGRTGARQPMIHDLGGFCSVRMGTVEPSLTGKFVFGLSQLGIMKIEKTRDGTRKRKPDGPTAYISGKRRRHGPEETPGILATPRRRFGQQAMRVGDISVLSRRERRAQDGFGSS